jgi:hypothetical protein
MESEVKKEMGWIFGGGWWLFWSFFLFSIDI